ncbi:gelsolin-like protein 2 isoform X2 [Tubulanus polymorphus]|uniref:gelsolin-like protein 2 isoform X2 n=1 Tax=Tubulanus polymorphus TaxID=672921 RepID=UPI003DA5661F
MSGLVKAKKYDWKDSNLALFGTPLEREIKKAAAETEKAWTVVNAKDEPGLFIWQIVKFVPTPWPEEDRGKFYSGDSYIILNKYKNPGEDDWEYDVHFWIGKHSSQDEYGTAAYKTVELDTYLDDKAIQRREVQGHESELFKSYFKTLEIMEGGADSGFRHVTPEQYKPRLLHIFGQKKNVEVREATFTRKSLNSVDCFVVDFGKKLYQFNGKDCNKDERRKAMEYVQKLRNDHNGAELSVIDEGSSSAREIDEFKNLLPDEAIDDDEDETDGVEKIKVLYRLSDSSGKLDFKKIAEGNVNKSMLCNKDVFFLDTGDELYVWVGRQASTNEIRNGMAYGHNYLTKTKNPLRPITRVIDGREGKAFHRSLM